MTLEGDLEETGLVGNRQRDLHVGALSEVVLRGVCASKAVVYHLGSKCLQPARFRLAFVSPLTMTVLQLHSGLVLLTDYFASNQPLLFAVEIILKRELKSFVDVCNVATISSQLQKTDYFPDVKLHLAWK